MGSSEKSPSKEDLGSSYDMGTTGNTSSQNTLVSNMTEAEITREKRNIMKNVFLISLSFLFTFNAYQSLARLQSSLHLDEGMGVINSSVLYGALILSCLFLPKFIIHWIGHKWTIPLSFMGYILWMAANGYAVWETMVPASILLGFAAAPLWTAQCSYFTIIGRRYSELNGEEEQSVISRFFGIFFFFFQLCKYHYLIWFMYITSMF